jgi:hypothetical protein
MTIDINKKYRTKSGEDVQIYAIHEDGPFPVHGAIKKAYGWEMVTWTKSGSQFDPEEDLVEFEVKPRIKRRFWVNVYPDHCCGAYREKRHADEMAAPYRIGCVQVEIECEEGEGL